MSMGSLQPLGENEAAVTGASFNYDFIGLKAIEFAVLAGCCEDL